MAQRPLSQWSTTPANNDFPVDEGGAPENWTGEQVNNSARNRMAGLYDFYADPFFVSTLFDRSPRGAPTLTETSSTTFQISKTGITDLFPAGRRIRLLDGASQPFDMFVVSAVDDSPAGSTTVTTTGGVPGAISEVFFAPTALEALTFAGTGTTVQRDAAVSAASSAPEGYFWFNTDDNTLDVYWTDKWVKASQFDAWDTGGGLTVPGASLRINLSANPKLQIQALADRASLENPDAGGEKLELRDDGDLYYNDQQLTPGKSDALTIGGRTVAQINAQVGIKTATQVIGTTEAIITASEITIPAVDGANRLRVRGVFTADTFGGTITGTLRVRVGQNADRLLDQLAYSASDNLPGDGTDVEFFFDLYVQPAAGDTQITATFETSAFTANIKANSTNNGSYVIQSGVSGNDRGFISVEEIGSTEAA